jgi:ATP-dependent Clp protease protease subunit
MNDYGIKVENKGDETGELTIYGLITDAKWFDESVTPKEFKAELDKLKNKKRVNVRINSPGGGVWAGMAIYNMLSQLKAETYGYVEGVAASIASVILQGCKHRIVAPGSMVMIHNPSATIAGDADDLRKAAGVLDKIKSAIISTYSERVGTGSDEIAALMSAETYMTAEEAVGYGFADRVEGLAVAKNMIGDRVVINGLDINLSQFRAFPTDKIPQEQPKEPPPAEPSSSQPVAESAPDFTIYDLDAKKRNLSFKLLEAL